MNLLIKNGQLIDPKNKIHGSFDILIQNGKVCEISKSIKADGGTTIDAKGLVVAPGFIDLHTHLREPGYEYKETIQSGTESAAAGGFTSICCMANTNPVNDQAHVTEFILKQAAKTGMVNVFPIGAVTKGLEGKELAEIGELRRAGCVAISDDGYCIQNTQVMRLAMEYAKGFDLPVITHSIDACMAKYGVMNEGIISTRLGLPGIPNEAEDLMIARDIYLAKLTGARLHLAHISTAEGVQLVKRAKAQGLPVTCEVTPHHLALTDERVSDYDTNSKMAPPLRTNADCEALVQGLMTGVIDAIATDHAPHAIVDKQREFDCSENGVVGLETAFGVVGSLIKEGGLTLEKIIECLTVGPARVVDLKKGSLEVGSDGDVVILNPQETYQIDPSQFRSKSKNSPFGGMQARGKIKHTIVGGNVVYNCHSHESGNL